MTYLRLLSTLLLDDLEGGTNDGARDSGAVNATLLSGELLDLSLLVLLAVQDGPCELGGLQPGQKFHQRISVTL